VLRITIVGGGIAGLSAAYYLTRGGARCTLIEARPRLGGVIETVRLEGCTLETGPDSFLSAKPAAFDLLRELKLDSGVIGSNDHLRRTFVRKGGKLVPLPDGLMMMVPSRIMPLVRTSLVGWDTKLRMALELLRSPRPLAGDCSVAEFIDDHYGSETVEYLAEPLLSGIYGGDPRQLSVRSVLPRFVEIAERYGSLTRGTLAERAKARARAHQPAPPLFRTLKGGLGQIVQALEAAIAPTTRILHGRVEGIEHAGNGYRLRVQGETIETDALVLACEAHQAAPLTAGLDPRLGELLGQIGYSSSTTITIGFRAADFQSPPEGFGFLVPRVERRNLAACTWVGTKFSHRVPEDKIVARCFIGGLEDTPILSESDESIAASVLEELREIAGVTAEPIFTHVARWPRAMAQYTVGHPARTEEIERRVSALPGLHLAGNAYSGIGVPDCIRTGRAAAERILKTCK
jgi:protoporphyrinogen/coproporphyrinogen III oxidase